MKSLSKLFFIFNFLILISSCQKENNDYEFPLAEENNINAKALEKAFSNGNNIKGLGALIVERNSIIIAEEYFDNYNKDDLFNVKSVTKSISSLLIGIALREKHIDSLNQKVTDYIGDLINTNDPVKRNITIKQVLTMTGGFEWGEWEDETIYNEWFVSDDQINFLYNQNTQYTPGTKFVYNSAQAHLLSVIIEESTGLSELDYANKYLFKPLEINQISWYDFPQGYNNGGSDLMIRPIDMVKIGRLCLNNGMYKGNQIVPSEWIQEATQMQVSTNNLFLHGEEYGYLWWRGSEEGHNFFWALGYGGQFIVCIPELDAVIVATSNFQLPLVIPPALWIKVEDLIMNEILPCIN